MHKRSLIFIFLTLVFIWTSLAQNINPNPNSQGFTLPGITRPSPEVSQLIKMEESSFNHYIGQPNIWIPILSKNLRGLKYNLGLNYNVSGIRVDERSSWVGKGWSLEASGVVSRTVVDIPDEISASGFLGIDHTDFYSVNQNLSLNTTSNPSFNLLQSHNTNLTNGSYNEYLFNTVFGQNQRVDKQRDVYQYSAFGRTGRFIFDRDENLNLIPKIIGNDNRDIIEVFRSNVNGNNLIDYFTITDTEGFKFIFDVFETTENSNSTWFVMEDRTISQSPITVVPEYRSAWKLTSVISPFGIELVSFNYDSTKSISYNEQGQELIKLRVPCDENSLVNPNSLLSKSGDNDCNQNIFNLIDLISEGGTLWFDNNGCVSSIDVNSGNGSSPPPFASLSGSNGGGSGPAPLPTICDECPTETFEPFRTITNKTITNHIQVLSNVIFTDGSYLQFIVNDNNTEYAGGFELNRISMLNSENQELKRYRFNYDEHLLTPLNQSDNYGGYLVLTDIMEDTYSYDDSNLYNIATSNLSSFTYNPFPIKRTHDAFGYYENKDSVGSALDNLAGSLFSIHYQTGAKKIFNWERNRYSFRGDKLLTYDEIIMNPDNFVYNQNNASQNHTTPVLVDYSSGPDPTNNFNSAPSASNYQIVDVAYDQLVEIKYTQIQGVAFIPYYNLRIWYDPIDANGNIDPSRDRGSFLFRSWHGTTGQFISELTAGMYRFYVAQSIFTALDNNAISQISTNPPNNFEINLNISTKTLKSGPLNWWLYGGGLRIKSIDYVDQNETVFSDKLNYLLEPNEINFSPITNDGYPKPEDYPGHYLNTGEVTHFFSSGSIDGETDLIRTYSYRKNPINTYGASYAANAVYYVVEKRNAVDNQMTHGSYVGYKNITQYKSGDTMMPLIEPTYPSDINEPKTKFNFDSPIDFNFQPENYSYPYFPYESLDFKRGNLRSLKYLDRHNKLIKETINEYFYDNADVSEIVTRDMSFVFNELLFDNDKNIVRGAFDDYQQLLLVSANDVLNCGPLPTSIYITNQYTQNDLVSSFYSLLIDGLHYNIHRKYKIQLKSSTSKSYFYDNAIVEELIKTKHYNYSDNNYQLSEVKTIDSKGDELVSKTFYPMDSEVQNEPNIALLINENKVNTPILSEKYVNGELTTSVLNTFRGDTFQTVNGPVTVSVADEVHTSKGDNPLESRLKYHRYDEYGNILEVSKKDGTRICYIYGYNKTLPIAKIEGLSYSALASKLGITEQALDAYTDQNLPQINNLRDSFTVEDPFMVTTYEYEVGIGITKVTDPRGRNMTYEYDDFNRLKAVRDHEGNILSENEYKYATQN